MDNKTAFWLAITIIAVLLADHFYFERELLVLVNKELARFSEWLAFWHDV